MQALKFKAQLTNVFFATINQMLSSSSQLQTTDEHSSDNKTVLSSSQKLGRATEHLMDGSKKVSLALNFRVLKGTVMVGLTFDDHYGISRIFV